MRLKNIIVGAVLCIALFAAAAPAYAQTASQNAYSHPAGTVQEQLSDHTSHHTTPVAARQESGKLPFTGLDIALVVAAGGVLLAMGFGIRRLSRPEVA